LWWRTHDTDDFGEYVVDEAIEVHDGLEWTSFSEDAPDAAKEELDPSTGGISEITGSRLRTSLRSVEGLARLMFSSILLCWNMNRVKLRGKQDDASPRRLHLKDWTDLNNCIEADGSTPSASVQKGIFKTLVQDKCLELLPESQQASKDHNVGQDDHRGWASIPPGGLERHETPLSFSGPAGMPGPKLAHCILSETSSSYLQYSTGPTNSPPQPEELAAGEELGEAVWLHLARSKYLFLATSPHDQAPYAFIRLKDASLREVSSSSKHLVLAGRKDDKAPDLELSAQGAPFGDTSRRSLPRSKRSARPTMALRRWARAIA